MSEPIQLIKGGKRQTVYGPASLSNALADGWQKVADLTPEQLAELTKPKAVTSAGATESGKRASGSTEKPKKE